MSKELTQYLNNVLQRIEEEHHNEAFWAGLRNEDPFVFVLFGQMGIEQVISGLLRRKVPRPEALRLDTSYRPTAIKLDFAEACGVVEPTVASAIRKLNEIRNNLAHRLDAKLTKQQARDFVNVVCQTPGLHAAYNREAQAARFPLNAQWAIALLWEHLYTPLADSDLTDAMDEYAGRKPI